MLPNFLNLYLFSREELWDFALFEPISLSCFYFVENTQEFNPNSTELLCFDAAYFLQLLINMPLVLTSSSYLMLSVISQFVADDIQISSRDAFWSHKQRIRPISEWLRHKVIDKTNKYLDLSNQSVVICKGENKTADISAIYHVFLNYLYIPMSLLINYSPWSSDLEYIFNYASSQTCYRKSSSVWSCFNVQGISSKVQKEEIPHSWFWV